MVALISLLIVLTLSILISRIATIALIHTGLAPQAARFQARSAFTGVGFTTAEAEKVVNHPVRRRILMLLMLLGNAGIVTVVASIMLTFVDTKGSGQWLWKAVFLGAGIVLLWTAANSQWLDQRLSMLITRLLKRWTLLDVRDYASLLHVGGEYRVAELRVEKGDWLANKKLQELNLREEGVLVLGIQYTDGTYMGVPTGDTIIHSGDVLLLYARGKSLEELDRRQEGLGGALAHLDAVAEQHDEAVKEREKTQAEQEPEA